MKLFISRKEERRRSVEEALQKSEEQARQLARENAIMVEIGKIISSTLNIEEVYESFAEEVRKLIPFDRININLIDQETRTLTSAYSAGTAVKGRQIGEAFPLTGSAAEEVMQTRSGLLLRPMDKEELERRFPGLVPSFLAGHRSMIVVPLISKDKVIGNLYFGAMDAESFTERELRLAESIGAQIAGAIASARLFIEREQMQEVLRKSEERFRELFDRAPVSYHEYDIEGRLTRVNSTELEMLGYSREEMIGQPMWRFNADEASARKRILGKLSGEIPPAKGYELTYRRKDGATLSLLTEDRLILDPEGRIQGMRGILQDITERKRVEEALQKSEEQARQLAHENAIMAKIGRIISSTLDIEEVYERFAEEVQKVIPFDRIVIDLANPQQRVNSIAYVSGIDIPGRRMGDTIPYEGSDTEHLLRTRSSVFIQGEEEAEIAKRFPMLVPPFRAGIRSMMSVPLISKDQVFGGLHIRSVKPKAYSEFELKLAERIGNQIAGAISNAQLFAEHQKLEERLRRAEKMEALGTLAGGVAHDLNNVLGVLVGYSELLLMEIPEGNPQRGNVSSILQASQRAAAIIQDLLTLARRGVAVSEVVQLNHLISGHLKTPEIDKLKDYHPHVTFKTDLDKDLMHIKGSPVHLSKTIMNLLSNAAEAISGHGEVNIVTENRYLDQPITGYDTIQEGDYVVLRVSDNGRGISSKDIGKIFEPFYTKKVMGRSGTGLGLAVVWGTVKDHGGYIDVQSEEGKGSRFTLYFPVTREEIPSDSKEISVESCRGRGESILVVDDVKEQRELATTLLTHLGYRVNAVASGEEALTHLKTNRVDLVVLDMIMDPGWDGLETYQRILAVLPNQKAIIVSGFSETDRVKKAQELGAGAYVKKPYILEKIGWAIRRELDRSRS